MPEGHGQPRPAVQSADAAFVRLMRDIAALDQPRSPAPDSAAERLADILSDLGAAQTASAPVRPAAARSFDLLSQLITDAMATVADFVDSGLRGAEKDADRLCDALVTLSGSPGSRTGTSIWIHQDRDAAVDLSTLRLTDLTAHDGSRLAGTAGTFCANTTAPSGKRSTATWLDVTIPDDLPTGTYHGHILAAASPETAINVRMRVQP
jgi:hypothetical protein